MDSIVNQIAGNISNRDLRLSTIVAVVIVILALSLYEYNVYRLVSHKGFYNKSFNISIAVLPLFVGTIILTLQSNLVITLGTIGALAIIRFRTAIKDPVDMIYILWSIHIGVTCGCQLYGLAIIVSVIVTIMLIIFNHVSLGKLPLILLVRTQQEREQEVINTVSAITKRYTIKSCNYVNGKVDVVIEVSGVEREALTQAMLALDLERVTVVEYNSEDVV